MDVRNNIGRIATNFRILFEWINQNARKKKIIWPFRKKWIKIGEWFALPLPLQPPLLPSLNEKVVKPIFIAKKYVFAPLSLRVFASTLILNLKSFAWKHSVERFDARRGSHSFTQWSGNFFLHIQTNSNKNLLFANQLNTTSSIWCTCFRLPVNANGIMPRFDVKMKIAWIEASKQLNPTTRYRSNIDAKLILLNCTLLKSIFKATPFARKIWFNMKWFACGILNGNLYSGAMQRAKQFYETPSGETFIEVQF